MNRNKIKTPNHLVLYRKRMRLSQKTVAGLLGRRNSAMLSRYEKGRSFPPLATALQLEIIYRVPVAFLFPGMYDAMRDHIRSEEARIAGFGQQSLFPAIN